MNCPYCGYELKENEIVCPDCGKSVSNNVKNSNQNYRVANATEEHTIYEADETPIPDKGYTPERKSGKKSSGQKVKVLVVVLCVLLVIAFALSSGMLNGDEFTSDNSESKPGSGASDEEVVVTPDSNIADIAVGSKHTVILKKDGTVSAIGDNSQKQCRVSDWTDIVAIDAGDDYTVGLKSNGEVIVVDEDGEEVCAYDIVFIGAGKTHAMGITKDGKVTVFYSKYTPHDTSDFEDIVFIDGEGSNTLGVTADGRVLSARGLDCSDWTDIAEVSVGENHIVGLKKDSTLIATGDNKSGQCNVGGFKDVAEVCAGKSYTVVLKKDGTVEITGAYNSEQTDCSGWTDIAKISVSDEHIVGLRKDGTLVATGSNVHGQCDVDKWNK